MNAKNIARQILNIVKEDSGYYTKSKLANYIATFSTEIPKNADRSTYIKFIIKIEDLLIDKGRLKLSSENKLIYEEQKILTVASSNINKTSNEYAYIQRSFISETYSDEENIEQKTNQFIGTHIKMNSLLSSFKKLENPNFEIGEQTRYKIEHPLEAYIDQIHQYKFSPKIETNIINFIKTDLNGTNIKEPKDFGEIIQLIKTKILNSMQEHNTFPSLTSRECRYLLYDRDLFTNLNYSAYKSKFIQYLHEFEHISTLLFRTTLIAYFTHYDILSNDNEFYEMFKNSYYRYFNSAKYIPTSLMKLNMTIDLLSKEICTKLAELCLNEKEQTSKSIISIIADDYKLINQNMDIYDETLKQIGLHCLSNIQNQFYLDTLIDDVLKANINKVKMDEFVSRLLIIFEKNMDSDIQNKIQLSILKNPNYGDPRINNLNWNNVEERAKKVFMSWLAKEDLQFFFELMFHETRDVHGRKKFWEQYINSENLLYSKVILSSYAAGLPETKQAEKDGKRFAKFQYSIDKTSCFILAFDSAYIVEFSEYANSVYFFRKDTPISMDKMRYPSVSALKPNKTEQYSQDRDADFDFDKISHFRMSHNDGWQSRVKQYLLHKLAIYPGEN